MNRLFNDNFLAAIARLGLSVRATPPRAEHGTHLSPRPGSSLEFRDYQPYAPGDDLRRVDWAVYRRTKHLFVRRFERPTAASVFVLVDGSASMHLDETPATPTRYATAARVAAAVASAAVAGQNPLRVVIADGQEGPAPRTVTGRRGLVKVLADLAHEDRPTTGPGPAAAIEAVRPALAATGRGVLVVVSDFFEPAGVDAIVDALRQVDGRLVLVRVTRPTDAEPQISDDLELTDCETGRRLHVSPTADAIARYRAAYASYFGTLDAYAASRGALSVTIDAEADPLGQLQTLFPAGTLSV
ncbi:MAG: DUF58 domain-containing protein [Tepidisphaeraceae bacterium]